MDIGAELLGNLVSRKAASYPQDELRRAGADAILANLGSLDNTWVERMFHPEISP